ncbi:MAG: hypothetical protein RL065_2094 [Bacteroidota bacterium]|jgi:DNA-binding NarL/FixJ family response regulator
MFANDKIHVILADDQPIFLEGLKKVFNETGYFDICGIALNGFELIELTEKHNPELIFTDLRMPYINGFEATRKIKKKNPEIRIIAISYSEKDEDILCALDAGVDGYITKSINIDEINDLIYNLWDGRKYFSNDVRFNLPKLIKRCNFNPYPAQINLEFSEIEIEIIKLICQEKTNDEIANIIHLGKRTVEGKRGRIIEKMNVSNSIGIAVYAIKHGIVKV